MWGCGICHWKSNGDTVVEGNVVFLKQAKGHNPGAVGICASWMVAE